MPHLLTLSDLPIETIHHLLEEGQKYQDGEFNHKKKNAFVANMFFEPSTRTRLSFEVAEKRLGYHVLPFDDQSSSTQKGESLYDTLRLLEEIGVGAAVIRHQQDRYFDELKDKLSLSIVNAGDGCGNHPTQSLLDLLTIRQEFIVIQGLTIVIVGDLRHSRVAKSNADVLTRLGAKVLLSGPPQWAKDQDIAGEYIPIDEAMQQADVVMMLRIQHERHDDSMPISKAEYHEAYGLTLARENQMKPDSIIMHPAPFNRGVEIADALVECERSRIFKQMKNGVAIRMAVLDWAMNDNKEGEKHGDFA